MPVLRGQSRSRLPSPAVGKSQESRCDPVLFRQLIVEYSDFGKSDHAIQTGIASPNSFVPNRHHNINLLENVQCVTHLTAVGDSRLASHEIPDRYHLIILGFL